MFIQKRFFFFSLFSLWFTLNIFAQETVIDVTGNDFTHTEYVGTHGRQIVVSENGDVHVVYQKSWITETDTGYNITWKNLTTGATDVLPYQMDNKNLPEPGVAYIGGGSGIAPIYFYYGMGGKTYKWGDMHYQSMAKVSAEGDTVVGLGMQYESVYCCNYWSYYVNPISMQVDPVNGKVHCILTDAGGQQIAYWNFDGTNFGETYRMYYADPNNEMPGKYVPPKYRRNATKGADLAISSDGSEITIAGLHPASNIWLHKGLYGGELWDNDFFEGMDNGTVVGLFDTTGTETGDNIPNNDPKPYTDLQVIYNENDKLVVVYTATYIDLWLDTAKAVPWGSWWATYSSMAGDTLGTFYDGSEHPKPQLRVWTEESKTHTKIAESMYPLPGTTLKFWEDGIVDSGWAAWGNGINDGLISHFNLISNKDAQAGEPKLVLAFQQCTSEPTMVAAGWDDSTKTILANRYYSYYSDIFIAVSMDGETWTTPINITNTPDRDENDLSIHRDVIDNQIHMLYFRDSKPGRDDWLSKSDTFGYYIYKPYDIFGIPIRTDQEDQVEIIYKKISFNRTDVDNENIIPKKNELSQNYPNPFNPTTTISYYLPKRTKVTIKVYNSIAQLVTTLFEGVNEVGKHKVNWNGSNVSSGVYYYKIKAGNFTASKKMILLK